MRPTCYQTETSSLPALNVFQCVEVLFQPSPTGKEASGFHDTEFTSTAETGSYKTCKLPDGYIITVGVDCLTYCSSPVYLVKELVEMKLDIDICNNLYANVGSFMKRDADIRKKLYANVTMPCQQVAQQAPTDCPSSLAICSRVEGREAICSWVESRGRGHDGGAI